MTEASNDKDGPFYGPSIGAALNYAAAVHVHQVRKGKDEPYLTHLLRVAQLALRFRDTTWPEDEQDAAVVGGILHDSAEDQGGEARLTDIEWHFGPRVAAIVRGCSDALGDDPAVKAHWGNRKIAHIAKIAASTDQQIALVTACDKSSNLEDLLDDIAKAAHIEEATKAFKGKTVGTCHYYRAMYLAVRGTAPAKATDHLRGLVVQLFEAAGLDPAFDSFATAVEAFTTGLEFTGEGGGSSR